MKCVQNNVTQIPNKANKKREVEAVGTKQKREQDKNKEYWTQVLLRNGTEYV
jgi:hypothetical protein